MFLQKALRGGLALVLACGLASLSRAIVPTARSETAQETAIGAYSYYGAGAVAAGVVAGAAVGAAVSTPYYHSYYPQPYYQTPCGPPYTPDMTTCPDPY
jgi:hypothetical protein